jgi:F-type H+-transporting ATPase subunit a
VAVLILLAAAPSARAAEAEAGHAAAAHDPLSNPFHHVLDASTFELPLVGDVHLPNIAGLQITKFMVLQLIAALVAAAIFIPLANKMRNGDPIRGRFWGFWEMLCIFIRDEVVRPTIGDPHAHEAAHDTTNHYDPGPDPGHSDPLKETLDPYNHLQQKIHTELPEKELGGHPADKYLPVVWSLFFYVLFCNLLGAIPGLGSPTGNIGVTAVLALFVFGVVLFVGMQASGVGGFWAALVPSLDLPVYLKIPITILLWPIELFGLLIKHFVLAVRLFANMMGGHTSLFVILAFVWTAAHAWLPTQLGHGSGGALGWGMYGLITAASIAGQIFVSLLELFVAFLQAYVFAFLATLFISAAVHPH